MSQFEVKANITADGSQFKRTIGNLKNDIIGLVTLDKAKKAMDDLMGRAKMLRKLSSEFGVDTKTLQAQEFALKAQGKSLEDLEAIYARLQRARKQAMDNPTGKQADIFAALGITPQEFDLRNTDFAGLFNKLRKGLAGMGSAGIPLFGEIFGRGNIGMATKLGPQFDKLLLDFERLGLVMEMSTINALADLSKQLTYAKAVLADWTAGLVESIATTSNAIGAAAGAYNWGKAFREMLSGDVKGSPELDKIIGEQKSGRFGNTVTNTVNETKKREAEAQKAAADAKLKEQMANADKVLTRLRELQIKPEEEMQTVEQLKGVKGKDLTALQQVGAYTSIGDPLVEVQLKQLKVQEKIERNTQPGLDDMDVEF